MSGLISSATLAAVAKAAGKAFLDIPAKRRGEWRGKLLWTPVEGGWRVDQDWTDPCRLWVEAVDLEYAFGGPFFTDGGSIPKVFQGINGLRLKPDSFPKSFSAHDWGYLTAKMYVRVPPGGDWYEVEMSRGDVDTILYVGLCAEGATLAESAAIYDGVRLGGSVAWNQHRKEDDGAHRQDGKGEVPE